MKGNWFRLPSKVSRLKEAVRSRSQRRCVSSKRAEAVKVIAVTKKDKVQLQDDVWDSTELTRSPELPQCAFPIESSTVEEENDVVAISIAI